MALERSLGVKAAAAYAEHEDGATELGSPRIYLRYHSLWYPVLSYPVLFVCLATYLPIYLSTYLPTNQSIDQSIDQSINHYPSILVILSRSYVLCPIGNILFPVSYPSKYLCRERGNNVGELERTWSTSKDILRSLCS